jgi:hypothetical protein
VIGAFNGRSPSAALPPESFYPLGLTDVSIIKIGGERKK